MSDEAPDVRTETAPVRRRRRMTRGRWIGLGILAVGLAAGLTTWLLLPQPAAPRRDTRTFTVTRGDQTATVGLTGTLSPRTQASLNFTVSGTVTKVYVSAGDTVKKGAKLARVDDDDLRDALALARANLDTALANLDDVSDSGTAAAVTAARAQVKSARAAVAQAEDDLDGAVLRATISGTVASVDLSEGDTITAGGSASGQGPSLGQSGTTTASSNTAHVVVVATDAWQLDGNVGSADLAVLAAGQPATVLPDGATEPIQSEVASVGIVATSSQDGSATFPVVINLTGGHAELFSGTTASATVTVAEYGDVLTVPTIAITTRDGTAVVTRVSGGTAEQVEVTTGRVFGAATEITSGLAEGDTVQVTLAVPRAPEPSTDGGIFGGGPPRDPEGTPPGGQGPGSGGPPPGAPPSGGNR